MRKACDVCGRPSDQARCPRHRRPRKKPTANERPTGRPYRGTALERRLKQQVWERDEGYCQKCGRKIPDGQPWDLGHRVPHAAGGPFELDNLQVEHVRCNREDNTGR